MLYAKCSFFYREKHKVPDIAFMWHNAKKSSPILSILSPLIKFISLKLRFWVGSPVDYTVMKEIQTKWDCVIYIICCAKASRLTRMAWDSGQFTRRWEATIPLICNPPRVAYNRAPHCTYMLIIYYIDHKHHFNAMKSIKSTCIWWLIIYYIDHKHHFNAMKSIKSTCIWSKTFKYTKTFKSISCKKYSI